MSETDLDTSLMDMAMGQPLNNGSAADHGLFVEFYHESVDDPDETRRQGRPCFKQADFVRVQVPGDRNVIERPVRIGADGNSDNVKFAREYQLFKANEQQTVVGTPLKTWPPINKSQVKELEYFRIQTVEQLAQVSDSVAQNFMGLNSLRELARNYIKQAQGGKPLVEMQQRLDETTQQNKALQNQVNELLGEVQQMRVMMQSMQAGTMPDLTPAVQPGPPVNPMEPYPTPPAMTAPAEPEIPQFADIEPPPMVSPDNVSWDENPDEEVEVPGTDTDDAESASPPRAVME